MHKKNAHTAWWENVLSDLGTTDLLLWYHLLANLVDMVKYFVLHLTGPYTPLLFCASCHLHMSQRQISDSDYSNRSS